jgi:hypothetical protein
LKWGGLRKKGILRTHPHVAFTGNRPKYKPVSQA